MANILHSKLTGVDLHEIKGAATAASFTIPIANGAGSTPFGFVSYNNITDKPNVPKVFYNNVEVVGSKTHIVTLTASGGLWTANISPLGFSTVYGVWATAIAGGTALGTACSVNVASVSTTAITGSVIIHSGSTNTLGTTQTIQLVIMGV